MQALPIAVGRGILDMASGQLTEVKAGGQLVGYLFQGQAGFTYFSEEPLEAAVFQGNLTRNTALKAEAIPGGGLVVKEAVTSALLWVTGRPLPGLPAPAGEAERGAAQALDDLLRLFHPVHPVFPVDPPWTPRAMELAAVRANDPEAAFLVVEMVGKREKLIFRHDASQPGSESLASLTLNGPLRLSEQAVGWSTRDVPIHPFLLSAVDLDLTAPGGRLARLKVVETLTPTRSGLTLLSLDLLNALDKERLVHLRAVRTEGGEALPFHHAGQEVLVALPKPTVAYEPVKVVFEVEGDLIYEPPAAMRWQLGLWPWFPQPPMGAQSYTVHAVARVKPPYVPIMPGTWLRRAEGGGYTVLETRIDRPVQFFVVDAGRFNIQEHRQGTRLVRVCTYHTETTNTERLGRLTHQFINFYEPLLGPFPFESMNLVQVQSYGFGQAPPGTLYITREAFNVISDDLARMVARGINDRIAHEVAHQYWGHLVKMATSEDQWLTEAFAEYSSRLAMLGAKGKGLPYYQNMVKDWERGAREAGTAASIAGANRFRAATDRTLQGTVRTRLLYDKGAYFLYDLHQKLGDDAFYKFLVNIPANIQWRFLSTQNLLDLLKAITGKDHTDHFDRYLWGTGMPDGKPARP